MKLKQLPGTWTVCRLPSDTQIDQRIQFCFIGKTDEETSLVCRTEDVPAQALEREDGWQAFRVEGPLDFSLVGILSELTGILAKNGIGLFAVSTFLTDYILVKSGQASRARDAWITAGHTVTE